MSVIAKCPFDASEIPRGGIDFAVVSKDGVLMSPAEPFLLWGWQLSPDLGIYSNSDSVGLGVDIPADLRMRDLQLDLALKVDLPNGAPLDVIVRANGEPLGQVRFTDASKEQDLLLDIPAEVVDRREGEPLVIRIDRIPRTGEFDSQMFLFPLRMELVAERRLAETGAIA